MKELDLTALQAALAAEPQLDDTVEIPAIAIGSIRLSRSTSRPASPKRRAWATTRR